MSDADATEALPIFPLSNVVLFPRVKTPLHLFEPRYRQLARDVIEGNRRFAMMVVRPEHVDDMPGNPPIFPVGCVGTVTEHQRLPDGRYNLVLEGDHRVRVVGETPPDDQRLYRLADVRRLEDPYPDDARERVSHLREAILLDIQFVVAQSQPGRSFDASQFQGVDDETFVNVFANAFAFPAEEKQGLLEADSIPDRFARLASALSMQRFEVERGSKGGRSTLH
ncbi:MAG: LON peptidase substrate-binding domain-containing protein [Myxococcota bacterium]